MSAHRNAHERFGVVDDEARRRATSLLQPRPMKLLASLLDLVSVSRVYAEGGMPTGISRAI